MAKDATATEPLLSKKESDSTSASSDSEAEDDAPVVRMRAGSPIPMDNPRVLEKDYGLTIIAVVVAVFTAGVAYLVYTLDPAGPMVDFGYSRYMGTWDDDKGLSVFYGVKYAATTAGENRFRAPQPPVKTLGWINATMRNNRRCPQTTIPMLDLTGKNSSNFDLDLWAEPTEDCLDMTIYTPLDLRAESRKTPLVVPEDETKEEKEARLRRIEEEKMPRGGYPVVVVLHAGGYGFGSREDLEPPTFMDMSKRGLITVLVNYRLGAFGFLSSEEVKKDGDLNVGLLDQRAALKWIKEHIHHFGGNPNRVTLWGQSAGAGSAVHHMLSQDEDAKDLFESVILSSPYAAPLYNYNDRRPIQLFKKFTELAGCDSANEPMPCLRSKPLNVLVKANLETAKELGDWGDFGYYPVKEDSELPYRGTGFIIPEILSKSLNSDPPPTFHGKRLLISHVPNEGFLFSSALVNDANFADTLITHLPELTRRRGVEAILETYPADAFQSAKTRLDAVTGDLFFNCLTYWLADAFSTARGEEPSTWVTQFMIPPFIHGLDVGYSFHTPVTESRRQVFEDHSGAMVAFVKNGDPDNLRGVGPWTGPLKERDVWKAWRVGDRTEKTLGVGVSGNSLSRQTEVEGQWGGRCGFWKETVEKTNL